MSNSDRPTDPDARSPYEHVLGELNEIKALCRATHEACTVRVANVERAVTGSMLLAVLACVLAACALSHG